MSRQNGRHHNEMTNTFRKINVFEYDFQHTFETIVEDKYKFLHLSDSTLSRLIVRIKKYTYC